jgi:hypothetical protein
MVGKEPRRVGKKPYTWVVGKRWRDKKIIKKAKETGNGLRVKGRWKGQKWCPDMGRVPRPM